MRYSRREVLVSVSGAAALLSSLGCHKEVDHEELLLKQLEDPSADQRWNATLTLRELRPVPMSFVPHLLKRLNDQDGRVRQTAAEALGELGPEGNTHLNELAKLSNEHPDGQVRFALQKSVAKISRAQ